MSSADASTFPPGPVIVLVEATVEPDHAKEFHEWYQRTHLPEVLACPGFRAAARYQRVDGDTHLALYVTDGESALEAPEVKAISGFAHLTPFVRYERRVYRRLPAG